MRLAWVLLVLLAAPSAAAGPMLVGVVPDLPGPGPGDEGVAVASDGPADLSGWSVTDGEGLFAFPPGTTLAAGQPEWVVGNRSVWATYQGPTPAFAWADNRLALANAGDEVRLLDPAGRVADSFRWGPGGLNATSPGLVYERDRLDGAWATGDAAWVTPRVHRIGESSLDRPTFLVHDVTLYSSPDSGFASLTGLIASARSRLHLHVYELRSAELVDALVATRSQNPGLDLQVLVEESPVGLTSSDRHATADALQRIGQAGGHVVLAGKGRYDDHHLKVLVADDAVAVQSENWVESGTPADPSWGNRGWGVVVRDAAMASWFAAWMADDRAAWDTTPFDLHAYDPLFAQPSRHPARSGEYGPIVAAKELHGDFLVTPLVAPDDTQDPRRDPLAALISNVTRRVDVEELELAGGAANRLGWSSADPLIEALKAAARRGVATRVLAAPPIGNDGGNDAELRDLASAGVQAAPFARPGIALLHNKGLIVDDAVVVGSLNGNHHSRSANREVDVILRGPGVAEFYEGLFDGDWRGASPLPDTGVVARDLHGLPPVGWPMLLAAMALAAKAWTSRRGRGPPSP